MKNLMILVKMQLKEQLNFKRLEVENVKIFHIFVSILGALLKFAMVTAMCVAFLLVSKLIGLFSLAILSHISHSQGYFGSSHFEYGIAHPFFF